MERVEFNMQQFLSEMRAETRDGHEALGSKIDEIKDSLADHDKRITVVENTRKTAKWLLGTAVVALLPILYDAVVNHIIK